MIEIIYVFSKAPYKAKFSHKDHFSAKLTVSTAGNLLEHEADTMADKVMSMPQLPQIQSESSRSIQGKCADCEEEELQRKTLVSFIQRKESSSGAVASDVVTSQIISTRGSGSNINKHTQSFMESCFGTDFSNIKIHTGNESIQMNRDLNAKAFTVGNDIYLNEGQYNPGSGEGRHLLAHELTHTIQQESGNIGRKI